VVEVKVKKSVPIVSKRKLVRTKKVQKPLNVRFYTDTKKCQKVGNFEQCFTKLSSYCASGYRATFILQSKHVMFACYDCCPSDLLVLRKSLTLQEKAYSCVSRFLGVISRNHGRDVMINLQPGNSIKQVGVENKKGIPLRGRPMVIYRLYHLKKPIKIKKGKCQTAPMHVRVNYATAPGFIGWLCYGKKRVTDTDQVFMDLHEMGHSLIGISMIKDLPRWFEEGLVIQMSNRMKCHNYRGDTSDGSNKWVLQLKKVWKLLKKRKKIPKKWRTLLGKKDNHFVGSLFFAALEVEFGCTLECARKIWRGLYNEYFVKRYIKLDNRKIREIVERVVKNKGRVRKIFRRLGL